MAATCRPAPSPAPTWAGSMPSSRRRTSCWSGTTRATTAPASRCTPSTSRPTASPRSFAADWGAQALAAADAHGGLERLGTLLGQDPELAAAVASRVAGEARQRADRGPPAGLRGRLRGPRRRRRGRRRRRRRGRRGRRGRGRQRPAVHRDPLQVLRGAHPRPRAAHPGPVRLRPGRRRRTPGRARPHPAQGHHRGPGARRWSTPCPGSRRPTRCPPAGCASRSRWKRRSSILGPDGTLPGGAAAARRPGRISALHYGTYDYSASLQIAARIPVDGAPGGGPRQGSHAARRRRHRHPALRRLDQHPPGRRPGTWSTAWRLHARLVRRSLERGYYQGWDLHPAQLPTRFAATYAFYRQGFPAAAARLRNYVERTAGGVMDEPATATGPRRASCCAASSAVPLGAERSRTALSRRRAAPSSTALAHPRLAHRPPPQPLTAQPGAHP